MFVELLGTGNIQIGISTYVHA